MEWTVFLEGDNGRSFQRCQQESASAVEAIRDAALAWAGLGPRDRWRQETMVEVLSDRVYVSVEDNIVKMFRCLALVLADGEDRMMAEKLFRECHQIEIKDKVVILRRAGKELDFSDIRAAYNFWRDGGRTW